MLDELKKDKEFYIEDVVATGRRRDRLQPLKVGANIKLVLRLVSPASNVDAERLWFRVIKINGDSILAELDNDPTYIKSLSGFDTLLVKRDNILEVLN